MSTTVLHLDPEGALPHIAADILLICELVQVFVNLAQDVKLRLVFYEARDLYMIVRLRRRLFW